MCGIIGYYGDNVKNFTKESRIDLIDHRGPDNKSFVKGNKYFLGHTRLSIQDISESANQPMISQDESCILIFNGEIYNHLELRTNLLNDFSFRSSGDTETLLYGLKKYGVDFINKLNGIFAFSFLNLKTGNLIISRDHFGVKPLYYHINNKEIYFQKCFLYLVPTL